MRKGQYKGEKSFDRGMYMKAYNKKFYAENKEQQKKRVKDWYWANPEKAREINKKSYQRRGAEYRKKNLEKIRKYQREWMKKYRQNNPEKIKLLNRSEGNKIRQKRYRRKRILTPQQKIRECLAIRMRTAIKRQYGIKAYKTIEFLGCSIDEVRKYLENQFTEGVSWENHGKVWEIDHKIPIDSFDLTKPEEQKRAFHYTNLQPLNWRENRIKSNRIVI